MGNSFINDVSFLESGFLELKQKNKCLTGVYVLGKQRILYI
jgi:hypothetical protein